MVRQRSYHENIPNRRSETILPSPEDNDAGLAPTAGPSGTDRANDQPINDPETSGDSADDDAGSFFDPSDAEEEGEGMMDGVSPWNSPEGWESVKTKIAEFCAVINEVGCVCAVCGERKHDTHPVSAADLRMWQVDGPPTASLIDSLYPPFPAKTFPRVWVS